MQLRLAPLPIEAGIGEPHGSGRHLGWMKCTAIFAVRPAHLKEVSEITGKLELEFDPLPALAEISDRQPLETGAFPEKFISPQVNEIMFKAQVMTIEDVGVREIADERAVVVPQCRAQQHRPLATERQIEMRKVTRIAVE